MTIRALLGVYIPKARAWCIGVVQGGRYDCSKYSVMKYRFESTTNLVKKKTYLPSVTVISMVRVWM